MKLLLTSLFLLIVVRVVFADSCTDRDFKDSAAKIEQKCQYGKKCKPCMNAICESIEIIEDCTSSNDPSVVEYRKTWNRVYDQSGCGNLHCGANLLVVSPFLLLAVTAAAATLLF